MRIRIKRDSAILKKWDNMVEKLNREDILDLGSGYQTGNFMRLDIDKDTNPDFHMDLRAFCGIAPYDKDLGLYSDVKKLDVKFKAVRAMHFLEHIEWIYQDTILKAIMDFLQPGGFLFIEVPNLKYIIDVYMDQIQKRLLKGKEINFPKQEYSFQDDDPMNIYKWFNFKLFSGCSPGDNHKCMYDIINLQDTLEKIGFEDIEMSDENTIKCVAFAPMDKKEYDIELAR